MFANDEVRRARKTFSAMRQIVEIARGAGENAMFGDRFSKDAKATKEDVWDREWRRRILPLIARRPSKMPTHVPTPEPLAMRTSNPALSPRAFADERSHTHNRHVMTVNGAVVKTGILTGVLIAAAVGAWIAVHPSGDKGYDPLARDLFGVAAPIAGFVIALITCFVPRVSPVTAPLYAICQGLFLGAISSFFSERYAGIALQAGLLTVGVLGLMMLAYVTGVVRATPRFTLGLLIAMCVLMVVYLAAWLLPMAGVTVLNPLFQSGLVGIGFSVIVVGLAAMNLILDFHTIEEGARAAAPKYMEWYAAFGLLVTLVWLYLELLRLLAKIRSNN